MTFDQVEQALPNGFHDAFLRSMSVDYVERTAQMELGSLSLIIFAHSLSLHSLSYAPFHRSTHPIERKPSDGP